MPVQPSPEFLAMSQRCLGKLFHINRRQKASLPHRKHGY
jgi:hypothetical protein